MHRSTTTAALLVTVAVSALSGCVTVQRPAAPARPPGTAPFRPSVPRPEGSALPRVVQAPAREALEMVAPSGRPGRAKRSEHAAGSAAPSRPAAPVQHHAPSARTPHPAPQPHHKALRNAHVDVPEAARRVASGNPDVCALGRKYGGWRQGSQEATICQKVYGH
ncbi:hypothetical protein [Streptomyces sp. V3I7]|uniref:hypothetical protein n=1 Tax=Streptomyces sp. V3I7 TaxID=3042278 RepID=UPI002780BBB7|nr:hypothetical protein [Streptomyces sp. V3I7]MDQ0989642.1 hypothetical protein [Streptomyces sp. V3I7]